MIEYKQVNQAYFILGVTDLQKAKMFYEEVFGFKVIFDYKTADLAKEIGWAELSLPLSGARLGLNLERNSQVIQGSARLSFYVKDIIATRKYIEKKGVETKDVPDDYMGMETARLVYGYDAFVMLDPFGNEIVFVGDDRTKVAKRNDEPTD